MTLENKGQYTILVIDDTPQTLEALIVFLEKAGFQIAAAPSGETALKQLEYTRPDVILLDVLMPGIDGFETCRRLKECEAARDVPVIFMTALSDTVDKVKGFDVGGVDYLTKPVQHEEVLARINAHLIIRILQQQLQKENERFQRLAEATYEGIIFHDAGHILDVNQAVVQMFGFSPEELCQRSVSDLLTSETRQIIEEKIRTRDEHPCEAAGVKKDGVVFPIEVQMKSTSSQEQKVLVAAVRDLTWRKAMEQEHAQLRRENLTLRSTMKDRYRFDEIIGKSMAMQEVYQSIARASASETNVLIYGESGTGKELVARTIHRLSARNEQDFVAVNCGAVPETLFEREFFGHKQGAFTGATMDKPGYFDQAHQGTLFLDEIGELLPALQVKLLRALEEKEYTPVGDTKSKKVDVRIITATNKDLKEQLQKGLIREDFFYRIRVIVINLPPLRERREDIPLLIDHFLEQYGDGQECPTIPARIIETLCAYYWPGNVRELQNELQRYLAEQRLDFMGDIQAEALQRDGVAGMEFLQEGKSFREVVETFERNLIAKVLAQNSGHLGKTAAMLDIPPRTLYRKIRKYEFQNDRD